MTEANTCLPISTSFILLIPAYIMSLGLNTIQGVFLLLNFIVKRTDVVILNIILLLTVGIV